MTDRDVVVKAGRFGPYIQLGEQKDYAEGEKPKRAGIPKNMSPGDIELELAPEAAVAATRNRQAPGDRRADHRGSRPLRPVRVGHEKTYASLEAGDEVFDIGLNRAVTLIAEKILKGPSGRRFGADPGKPLGDHPTLGGVAVKSGRYGAYVTAGGVNATIPSDKTQDTITLPEAIALIDERVAKGGGKPKRVAKKAKPAKSAKATAEAKAPKPAKKAAAKKATGQAEIGRRQQGARAGDGNRQNVPRQDRKAGCEKERREGKRIAWHSNATRFFQSGTPLSPSSAPIREKSAPARSRGSLA